MIKAEIIQYLYDSEKSWICIGEILEYLKDKGWSVSWSQIHKYVQSFADYGLILKRKEGGIDYVRPLPLVGDLASLISEVRSSGGLTEKELRKSFDSYTVYVAKQLRLIEEWRGEWVVVKPGCGEAIYLPRSLVCTECGYIDDSIDLRTSRPHSWECPECGTEYILRGGRYARKKLVRNDFWTILKEYWLPFLVLGGAIGVGLGLVALTTMRFSHSDKH